MVPIQATTKGTFGLLIARSVIKMNSKKMISDLKWLVNARFGTLNSRIRQVSNGYITDILSKNIPLRKIHSTKGTLNTFITAPSDNVDRLFRGIAQEGRRSSLAEGITLVESSHPTRKQEARRLLTMVLAHIKERQATGHSLRIGISGPPGAGKSTFIEAFGRALTNDGYRIAVLAVDPSSSSTGGSLLGDKTRMPQLSRDPNAYVRPSPTRGRLGGVTQSTGDAVVLCEGAGYNRIIVETVGVGQSEVAVGNTVDIFVLVIPPASGDELQGIKRGIIEHSDLIVITKSDGDLEPAAKRVQAEYTSALKFVRTRSNFWQPKVMRVSAFTGTGIPEFCAMVNQFQHKALTTDNLLESLRANSHISDLAKEYEQQVMDGMMPPSAAAHKLLSEFLRIASLTPVFTK